MCLPNQENCRVYIIYPCRGSFNPGLPATRPNALAELSCIVQCGHFIKRGNHSFFCDLFLPIPAGVIIYHPFNAIFVSEHRKVGAPGTVANGHFNITAL